MTPAKVPLGLRRHCRLVNGSGVLKSFSFRSKDFKSPYISGLGYGNQRLLGKWRRFGGDYDNEDSLASNTTYLQ